MKGGGDVPACKGQRSPSPGFYASPASRPVRLAGRTFVYYPKTLQVGCRSIEVSCEACSESGGSLPDLQNPTFSCHLAQPRLARPAISRLYLLSSEGLKVSTHHGVRLRSIGEVRWWIGGIVARQGPELVIVASSLEHEHGRAVS